jgi:hypothetical protein
MEKKRTASRGLARSTPPVSAELRSTQVTENARFGLPSWMAADAVFKKRRPGAFVSTTHLHHRETTSSRSPSACASAQRAGCSVMASGALPRPDETCGRPEREGSRKDAKTQRFRNHEFLCVFASLRDPFPFSGSGGKS